ncbi:MAG: NRDE family protein [Bacteroidia bacterium]|nr:NRDE family protein [Bacteroidia bacterium]
MCTVSYIWHNNKVFITSNRDENVLRPTALEPKEEIINGCKLIFPKDPKSGGTWFAINQNGSVAVLLNGAFEKHVPLDNYAISRGLILLDIISNLAPVFYFDHLNLLNIEPFTLILFERNKLFELRWDGTIKFKTELESTSNYIWSSSTLYSAEIANFKANLFQDFLIQNEEITDEMIMNFHTYNHNDSENGFVINRANKIKTFSITQALINGNSISLNHTDLLNQSKYLMTVDTVYVNTIN